MFRRQVDGSYGVIQSFSPNDLLSCSRPIRASLLRFACLPSFTLLRRARHTGPKRGCPGGTGCFPPSLGSSTGPSMRAPYADLISEPLPNLIRAKRARRSTPLAPRVQMLRLFKDGTCASQIAVAAHLGYSERQVRRWWIAYSSGGGGRDRPAGGRAAVLRRSPQHCLCGHLLHQRALSAPQRQTQDRTPASRPSGL